MSLDSKARQKIDSQTIFLAPFCGLQIYCSSEYEKVFCLILPAELPYFAVFSPPSSEDLAFLGIRGTYSAILEVLTMSTTIRTFMIIHTLNGQHNMKFSQKYPGIVTWKFNNLQVMILGSVSLSGYLNPKI